MYYIIYAGYRESDTYYVKSTPSREEAEQIVLDKINKEVPFRIIDGKEIEYGVVETVKKVRLIIDDDD